MSRLGHSIIAEIYGESHTEKVGVIIRNLPKGYVVSKQRIQHDLDRRAAKNNLFATPRHELDEVVISHGLIDEFTTGGKFEGYIMNQNIKPAAYAGMMNVPRPGHADYAAIVKNGGNYPTGGGKFSGRMTAPMVIMGSVAKQILETKGIAVCGYISNIGGVDCGVETSNAKSLKDDLDCQSTLENVAVDSVEMSNRWQPSVIGTRLTLPIGNIEKTNEVMGILSEVSASGDSVGGKVECVIKGVPIGVGDAMWDGIESSIAYGLYGIPAVKAVEFGSGTQFSTMRGSVANDSWYYDELGMVGARSNHNGGINGGISNGLDIIIRVTFKATPSISLTQESIDLKSKENVQLNIKGRHDCCILPRAVVVVESVVAFVMMDLMSAENKI